MKKSSKDSKISNPRQDARTRLRLARQTLRQLTTRELTAVAGGDANAGTRTCTTNDEII